MSDHEKPIAAYKILSDEQGTRYRFFCDLSGLAVYTSAAIKETGEHGKLLSVWESEAK